MKEFIDYNYIMVDALETFGVDNEKLSITDIMNMWNAPGRFYHTTEFHLFPLLEEIHNYPYFQNDHDKKMLIVVAIFHDIVYNKIGDKDVDDSVVVFIKSLKTDMSMTKDQHRIIKIISNTKDHKPRGDKLSDVFNELDCKVLEQDLTGLLQYERNIFLEYQEYPFNSYKEKRLDVLRNLMRRERYMLPTLIEYVENFVPKIGIYAGSFNPFHTGHLNIVEKAENVFDKVILAQLRNPDKPTPDTGSLLNLHRELMFSDGLLIDVVKEVEKQGADVTLIRGLRNISDFEEEEKLAYYLKQQKSDIKIAYFMCDPGYKFVSSSDVRTLLKIDTGLAKKYLVNG